MTENTPNGLAPLWAFSSIRSKIACAALLIVGFSGCSSDEGPPRIAINGAVKLDGKELPAGVIRFIPTEGTQGPAASATIQNGHYELTESDGPVLGSHRVEIEAMDYFGFAIDDEAAFAQATKNGRRRLPKSPVPDIYNRNSTLKADFVEDGPREFNFDLQSRIANSRSR